jgi:hypothetical protein
MAQRNAARVDHLDLLPVISPRPRFSATRLDTSLSLIAFGLATGN